MSEKILHDPLSGFHDIAGPPMFILQQSWLLYLIIILSIVALGFAIYYFLQRLKKLTQDKLLSAYDRFQHRLSAIQNEKQQKTTREVSSALSLALRAYFDEELETKTQEHTRKELLGELVKYRAQFQAIDFNKFIEELSSFMEKLELLTFSDRAEMLYESESLELQNLNQQGLKLARMVRDRKLVTTPETNNREV